MGEAGDVALNCLMPGNPRRQAMRSKSSFRIDEEWEAKLSGRLVFEKAGGDDSVFQPPQNDAKLGIP